MTYDPFTPLKTSQFRLARSRPLLVWRCGLSRAASATTHISKPLSTLLVGNPKKQYNLCRGMNLFSEIVVIARAFARTTVREATNNIKSGNGHAEANLAWD